ncbi:MAG: cytochrome b/b6 domain-containing protein [Gammaproteobacteria bacterium]|nr:cytochrome b/b6 domain-containing protein [Gammaproteobacteria bacterium]
MTNSHSSWSLITRLTHWGLAVTISAQLASGLLVADPHTRLYFYFHEYDGLAASVFILMAWLWAYADQEIGLLFPWNAAGMAAVKADIRALLRKKTLPPGGQTIGLASFGHGLGLLAVTVMAISGVWIFFIIPGGHGAQAASTDFRAFMEVSAVHTFTSYLVWLYLVGHIGFAVAHQREGTPIFRGIFWRPAKGAKH